MLGNTKKLLNFHRPLVPLVAGVHTCVLSPEFYMWISSNTSFNDLRSIKIKMRPNQINLKMKKKLKIYCNLTTYNPRPTNMCPLLDSPESHTGKMKTGNFIRIPTFQLGYFMICSSVWGSHERCRNKN
jgi:hypothetical protein